MRVETVFSGFPGKLLSGYMEWSAVIFVACEGKKILFDTGGTGKRADLCPRLAALGVAPEEIDLLVISHFHSDHVYNFQYFSNASILMHEEEMAYAQKGEDPWQPPFFYDAVKATGRLQGVREGQELASGVSVLHLPGHTPGCMGLLLTDQGMPATVLAGDAVKNIVELATGGAAMSIDQEATRKSIQKVRSVAERVIPGHDRILHLEKDRVVAASAARETIVVPAGVVDKEQRRLELTLEPTWLPLT